MARAEHAKAAHHLRRVDHLRRIYNMGNVRAGDCHSTDGEKYTAAEVFDAGCRRGFNGTFSLSECQAVPGFGLSELREAGFSASELRQAGKPGGGPLTFSDLWAAGFREGFKTALFSVFECSSPPPPPPPAPPIKLSLKELRVAGFSAADVMQLLPPPTAGALVAAGFEAEALKSGDFSASDLHASGVSVRVALEAGFSVAELLAAYLPKELHDGGVGPQELQDALDPRHPGHLGLPRLKELGFSAFELRSAGADLADLRRAKFTARELRDAGATLEELLRVAHFSGAEVCRAGKDFGDSLAELWAAGARAGFADVFDAADFADETTAGFGNRVEAAEAFRVAGYGVADARKASGFTVAELKQAGYELVDVLGASTPLKECRDAGFDLDDFRRGAHANHPLVSNLRCKAAGFTAKDFAEGGDSWANCRAGGADPCGFAPEDFLADGVTLKQCREFGMSVAELHAVGNKPTSLKDLKDAGFTLRECLDAGLPAFGRNECRQVGFSLQDFLTAGESAGNCKLAGFTAADFKNRASYSFEDCQKLGFSVLELAQANFDMFQLAAP